MNSLELTDVYGNCGAVLWIGQAHSCPRRALASVTQTARPRSLTPGRARTPQRITPIGSIRMATLNPAPPAPAEDTPAPALDPSIVTHMAATLLRKGYTTDGVREHAAGRPRFNYMWLAIASAMDALAAADSVPAQRSAPVREAAPA